MNNNNIPYDQIDAYIRGFMSYEERLSFEEKLSENIELQNAVALERLTNEAIFQFSILGVRHEISDEFAIQKKAHYHKKVRNYLFSGIIIISLSVVLFWVLQNKE